jgi:hypothetical protein
MLENLTPTKIKTNYATSTPDFQPTPTPSRRINSVSGTRFNCPDDCGGFQYQGRREASPRPKVKKLHDEFRTRIESCKQYRRKLIPNWTASIDYRRGKPFTSQTDEDQIAVNLDWSMTKMKQAMLFSQVPKIRIDHSPRTLPKQAPWAASYELRLNEILVEAGIESAMDECLPDCINAAGIGAILVSFEVITEDKQVPAFDMSSLPPDLAMQAMQTGELNGEPIPMESVPQKVDQTLSHSEDLTC